MHAWLLKKKSNAPLHGLLNVFLFLAREIEFFKTVLAFLYEAVHDLAFFTFKLTEPFEFQVSLNSLFFLQRLVQ